MACCRGNKTEADARSAAIDKQLRQDGKKFDREMKLLLLGAGGSGKSTFAKQIKLLHLSGFNDAERHSYRPIIYSNLILAIKQVVAAAKVFHLPLEAKARKSARHLTDSFFIFPEDEPLGDVITKDVKTVWADPAIKSTFARRGEFDLIDNAAFLFQHIDRISQDNYVPSDADILHSRQRTRGIIETVYNANGQNFRMVDVGGQRNERNKWIHCFENVAALLYCASLSEYNQQLEEDPDVNRMLESLNLWEGICRYRWFDDTAIVLFLNKRDLLPAKLANVPLTACFPNYLPPSKDMADSSAGQSKKDKKKKQTKSSDSLSSSVSAMYTSEELDSNDGAIAPPHIVEDAMRYICARYLERKVNPQREVKVHYTCATDTGQMQIVFEAVYEQLLISYLDEADML